MKEGGIKSWTRQRDMPLHGILTCTLGKKGLSAAMEARDYFQAAGKAEQTISKYGYLKQRQKLNPEVFTILNRNYLGRFYVGPGVKEWRGYLLAAAGGSRRTKVRRKYRTAKKTGGYTGKA
jgi:hypothetical protein